MIALRVICDELKLKPQAVRKKLRRHGIVKHRWAWDPDDEELDRVKDVLKGKRASPKR